MLLCLRLPARCAFVQAFDFAHALGMNVVRIWAYGEGQKKKTPTWCCSSHNLESTTR
jgi:hypothetical protein